jgi:hypothetical protein
MILVAFVKKEHTKFITNLSTAEVPTGFGKIIGNKGGLWLSFKLYNTSYSFINTHLAPG